MKASTSKTINAKEIRFNYLNGCSVTTFWRLRGRDKEFPKPIKVGGLLFWDRDDVEAWYNEVKSTGGSNA